MSESKSEREPSAREAGNFVGGYSQTYVILKGTEGSNNDGGSKESKNSNEEDNDHNEVFFRCGNWCYKGEIQRSGLKLNISDLPVLIPTLQRQQGSLRYFCNATSVPSESVFSDPLEFVSSANMFIATEVSSDHVDNTLRKWGAMYPWIDDDATSTYFELMVEPPAFMDKVAVIASKIYYRGLILISIFHEQSIYFIVQPGEGDQPLLDVRFPDVSRHGQGLQVTSYDNLEFKELNPYWKRLTLWHILEGDKVNIMKEIPKIKTLSVSSKDYVQTYCILKNTVDDPTLASHHDVLFRFGSWCYSGRVQLIPTLSLTDIPFVIPALRMQQSRLDFLCEVSKVPLNSHFAPILQYMQQITPIIENLIVGSEEALRGLIDRLSALGLGESVSQWLEGEPESSFFEFVLAPDAAYERIFNNVELVASKCYHASGIITMTILFQHTVYVCLLEGDNENPLLDSRFPDVAGKGRGYQVQAYEDGVEGWNILRKSSVWQTVNSLETEFRDRAAKVAAQAKDGEPSASLEVGDDEDIGSERKHEEMAADAKVTTSMDQIAITGGSESKDCAVAESKDAVGSPSRTPSSSATLLSAASPLPSSPSGLNTMPAMAARPHHLPKMEGLSKKMDELRRKMEMGDDDMAPAPVKKKKGKKSKAAPWDEKTGAPVAVQPEDREEDNFSHK